MRTRLGRTWWAINSTTVSWLFLVCILAMRFASTPSANLSYFLLAGYALLGRAQAIQAVALSWLFSMLSSGIVAEATTASIGRFAVLVGASTSVLLRSNKIGLHFRIRPFVMATLMLGLLVILHSILFSAIVDVSVLKAVSWTLLMTTLLAAWLGLSLQERDMISRQIFGGLIVVLLMSLPLIASPLGYLRNGEGFQGVLNHPQAFGPTMAILGAWAVSRVLSERRPTWLVLALVPTCLVLIVLSQARTAALSMIIGVAIATVLAPNRPGRSGLMPRSLHSKRVQILGLLSLLALVVFAPQIGERFQSFVAKRGQATTLGEAYQISRGSLMIRMQDNISRKPMQGIGFGIASELSAMDVQRDSVFGLPLAAPVEKGVLPIAVLEELGLLGFVCVAGWFWMLFLRVMRAGITPLAVSLTALIMNFGEATFFSPGGLGLLSLILVSWAYACGESVVK